MTTALLARLGVAVITVSAVSACAGDAGPRLPAIGTPDAVEVHFGGRTCRRIEDPGRVQVLADLTTTVQTHWQPFWGEPEQPNVVIVYLRGTRPLLKLGIDAGQLLVRINDRAWFRPAGDGAPRRFVDAIGIPGADAAAASCRSAPALRLR